MDRILFLALEEAIRTIMRALIRDSDKWSSCTKALIRYSIRMGLPKHLPIYRYTKSEQAGLDTLEKVGSAKSPVLVPLYLTLKEPCHH